MTSISKPLDTAAILAICLLTGLCNAGETGIDFGGHGKARLVGESFPENSLFRDLTGSTSLDAATELRLNVDFRRGRWSFDGAYQLSGVWGDRVEFARSSQGLVPVANGLPEDERRLFDLTGVFHDEGKSAALHRLDRLWVGYATGSTVLRIGRQAISWGNGLFFAPMDIVNPFDPAAIDTEYKAGDDMLYAQFLRGNGDDVQGAIVLRSSPLTGDPEGDEGTAAVKYHGISDNAEYDLLAALIHGDPTIGIGGNRNVGGAVARADLIATDADSGTALQVVANLSYSWNSRGRNMSGALEYYYNGLGQGHKAYDLQSLSGNLDLLDRLERGELYTIGRHYLAGSVLVEVTPLWLLTPTLFLNIEDGSALIQVITQHSLGEDLSLLASLNVALGPHGSEYGGIASLLPGRYLSRDAGVFAQLAWYF